MQCLSIHLPSPSLFPRSFIPVSTLLSSSSLRFKKMKVLLLCTEKFFLPLFSNQPCCSCSSSKTHSFSLCSSLARVEMRTDSFFFAFPPLLPLSFLSSLSSLISSFSSFSLSFSFPFESAFPLSLLALRRGLCFVH